MPQDVDVCDRFLAPPRGFDQSPNFGTSPTSACRPQSIRGLLLSCSDAARLCAVEAGPRAGGACSRSSLGTERSTRIVAGSSLGRASRIARTAVPGEEDLQTRPAWVEPAPKPGLSRRDPRPRPIQPLLSLQPHHHTHQRVVTVITDHARQAKPKPPPSRPITTHLWTRSNPNAPACGDHRRSTIKILGHGMCVDLSSLLVDPLNPNLDPRGEDETDHP